MEAQNYLTSFQLTQSNGVVRSINMAAGVTLSEAKAYFIGPVFVESDEITRYTIVNVEQL